MSLIHVNTSTLSAARGMFLSVLQFGIELCHVSEDEWFDLSACYNNRHGGTPLVVYYVHVLFAFCESSV